MDSFVNSIQFSDYRDKASEISDKSIDLIICDPPYGETNNEWDHTSETDVEDLFDFFDRIRKEHAPIVMFGQKQFAARLKLRDNFKYDLIWAKDRPSGFLNAKIMPLRDHEEIIIFYDKQPTYNPQMWKGEENHSIGNAKEGLLADTDNNYGDYSRMEPNKGKLKYPRSVLYFPKPHPPIHPTQKPVELYQWLIRTYTNEGDLVLDPMAGSAPTAVACIHNNRKYICFENNEDHFDTGKREVEKAKLEENTKRKKVEMFNKFFS